MAKRKWIRVGLDLKPIEPPEPPRWAIDTREKAVAYLIQKLSRESREVVRNTKREDLIRFHLDCWGMGIRKELGLWGDNVHLLRDLSPDAPIHADAASMILIRAVWERLRERVGGEAMTEAEWDACAAPSLMFEFVRDKTSDRKLRLFVCACCRSIWPLVRDDRSRHAVEVAERYADGLASDAELGAAELHAEAAAAHALNNLLESNRGFAYVAAANACLGAVRANAMRVAIAPLPYRGGEAETQPTADALRRQQADSLRDILGNPFRPAALDPSWLAWNDGAVCKMVQAIYDGRAFGRLPLLADALEDAGCADAAVLGHCRGGGEHVRGCWVIDLLLGKE